MSNETPRTDALMLEINEGRVYETKGLVEQLARQLERELSAAQARLAAIESAEMPKEPGFIKALRVTQQPNTGSAETVAYIDALKLHAQKLAADLAALRELDNRTLEEKFAEDVVHTRELAEAVRQRDQAMVQHVKDLAAANERAERMREALRHIAITDDADCKHAGNPAMMIRIARAALSGGSNAGESNG